VRGYSEGVRDMYASGLKCSTSAKGGFRELSLSREFQNDLYEAHGPRIGERSGPAREKK
jgi:hypothetical protein